MSRGRKRVMPTSPLINKNRSILLHCLLVHLLLKTRVSTMVRVQELKPTYSQGSVAQGGSKPPAYAKCGRNYSAVCC